jgi:hypothetical protein
MTSLLRSAKGLSAVIGAKHCGLLGGFRPYKAVVQEYEKCMFILLNLVSMHSFAEITIHIYSIYISSRVDPTLEVAPQEKITNR